MTVGETVCKECGCIKNPVDDYSPTLWCLCPIIEIEVSPDEDLDPSEIDNYYDVVDHHSER